MNDVIKVGGIQKIQVLWQAVFLKILFRAPTIPPATQARGEGSHRCTIPGPKKLKLSLI